MQFETKWVFSQKLCIAHVSPDINGKHCCQTLYSSLSNGLHRMFNEFISIIADISLFHVLPSTLCKDLTPLISCLLVYFGVYHPHPLHGHCPGHAPPRRQRDKGLSVCLKLLVTTVLWLWSSSTSACRKVRVSSNNGSWYGTKCSDCIASGYTVCQNVENLTPCSLQLRGEHGRELKKVAARLPGISGSKKWFRVDRNGKTPTCLAGPLTFGTAEEGIEADSFQCCTVHYIFLKGTAKPLWMWITLLFTALDRYQLHLTNGS